jgi:hypothetical protein
VKQYAPAAIEIQEEVDAKIEALQAEWQRVCVASAERQ